ncbi:MAG TPA: CHASE3 domain-containing protein [Geminicoccaceae bacterium]|nr:CHASE3 domain-containing protein [Geminicoccus sp.]HMU51195.1 CHASE3 domain-containing protein [Geminicoccaceae bacterium]
MPRRRSTVAGRTLGFLAAGVAALVVIVAATVWLAVRTTDHAAEVRAAQQVRAVASSMLSLLLDAETAQRGFLITGQEEYLEPYEAARSRLAADLDTLRQRAADGSESAQRIAELSRLIDDKLAELARTIGLARSGERDAAVAIVRSDRGKAVMDQIRGVIGPLITRSDQRVLQRLGELQGAARILAWTTAVGAVLILAFAAAASATVLRYTRELAAARGEVETLNRDLEQRVAERTADLSRANDEIQRFAYIVSHDLRSPLVNIMGFTSELEIGNEALKRLVGEESPDAATVEAARVAANQDLPEAVGFIRASTAKMDRLINAILKLSREGRRELMPRSVDLGRLVASTVAAVQHQVESAGARIEVEGRFPTIVSDRLALEQVMGNLLDNALKYLDPGRPGLVSVRAEEAHGRVRVTVEDNGRGIDPRDHERIFELFRRSGAQDRPGEGIGLAHVRATVRRLGGDITVRSRLGEGASFRLDLPMTLPRSDLTGRE